MYLCTSLTCHISKHSYAHTFCAIVCTIKFYGNPGVLMYKVDVQSMNYDCSIRARRGKVESTNDEIMTRAWSQWQACKITDWQWMSMLTPSHAIRPGWPADNLQLGLHDYSKRQLYLSSDIVTLKMEYFHSISINIKSVKN